MMNRISTICFVCLLILVSCTSKNPSNIFVAEKNIHTCEQPLSSKLLKPIKCFDGDALIGTTGIVSIIGKYMILGINSSVNRFRVIDISSFNHVSDFCHKGNGPNEDVGLLFSQHREKNDVNLLDVYAMNKHCLLTIDFDRLVETGEAVFVERIETVNNAMKAYRVGDYIVAQTYFDEDCISIKTHSIIDTNPIMVIPLYGHNSYLIDFYPFFASCNVMKPDGTKMVMFMHKFDKINILDFQNYEHLTVTTSRRLQSDSKIISKMIANPNDTYETYYYYGAVTNDYIYALRIGECLDKSFDISIQIFDWNFNFLLQYNIEEPITTFAIDEDDLLLYGLTRDEKMYVYQMDLLE